MNYLTAVTTCNHWFLRCCGVLQILQQLDQAKHVADFSNYLSFIFSKGDNLPMEVRSCSSSSSSSSGAASALLSSSRSSRL
jgi:hypothetical protein